MLNYIKSSFKSLTKFELTLWLCSVAASLGSIFVSGTGGIFSAVASVIGATCLIFSAKGNILSQVLSIIFALMYAAVSYTFRYWGEMITYACMTLPMAVWSLISWLRNPYSKTEVKVNVLCKKEICLMFILTASVTAVFYFVLAVLNTPNLAVSTVSVTTSFLACYLIARRNEYFAIAYAANDIVLIALWVMASAENLTYIPMVICFVMFLINDIYSFTNWRKMKLRQNQ